MKPILMMVLIICLNGCQSFPKFNNDKPVERCGLFIESNYVGKCRCHDYIVKNGHIGRVSDSRDMPLEYCNKLVGFAPGDWGKFVNWFESIFSTVNKIKRETSK